MILHHIGVVVDNLEEAIPIYETWMRGVRVGSIIADEVQQARMQLILLGDGSLLEIIEPFPNSANPVHEQGEYHLCFTVPDLDVEMARLRELGALVTRGTTTATPFENRRLGFLATHSGQLLELLEDPTLQQM